MVGSKVSPSIPQLVLAALLAGSSVSARTWEGGDHHTHLSSPYLTHHINHFQRETVETSVRGQ